MSDFFNLVALSIGWSAIVAVTAFCAAGAFVLTRSWHKFSDQVMDALEDVSKGELQEWARTRGGPRTVLVATAVIEFDRGKYVVGRRHDPDQPHLHQKWEFPGGKVEPGEDPRQAVIREIHEEVGIAVDVAKHPLTVVVQRSPDRKRVYVLHVYKCASFENGSAMRLDPDSHAELKVLTAEQIRFLDCVPSTYDILRAL